MSETILVLGAGGFIGSAVYKELCYIAQFKSASAENVFGTTHGGNQTRVKGYSTLIDIDLVRDVETLFSLIQPTTIINCVAYGSHPNEKDISKIYATNFDLVRRIVTQMPEECRYIHAGSSSEYGYSSANSREDQRLTPNSDYAVSKAAASQLIEYYGKEKRIACCNLRLYSVYGPGEDSNRLVPTLIAKAITKQLPKFVNKDISRDFVYIDDVVEAFVNATYTIKYNEALYGEAYNICTGVCTDMNWLAFLSRALFDIQEEPEFTMPERLWDKPGRWYGNNYKAADYFWKPKTDLAAGLVKTYNWQKGRSS